ncbi:hypothetical protein AMR42_06605 [Limnothrix sp. PR1529]|nr:hypothetical protein BCR12_03720 [Limnothrix sp. P13C2]PIB14248.1 hypothetical protein AMR42_06605 [Limnothrix sp. PR1529]
MAIGAGFAAIVLSVFLDGGCQVHSAEARAAVAFLSGRRHGLLLAISLSSEASGLKIPKIPDRGWCVAGSLVVVQGGGSPSSGPGVGFQK